MVGKYPKRIRIAILIFIYLIPYAQVRVYNAAASAYENIVIEPEKFNTGNNATKQFSVMNHLAERHTDMLPDLHFSERLRSAQKYNERPLVNDIIVTTNNNESIVYVIINNGNAMNEYRHLRNVSVELWSGNKYYKNLFSEVREYPIRLLKFVVNKLPKSGTVSLYDHSTSFLYKNLPYLSLSAASKRKIAVCAYISEYNSINEIKSFLAYYLLQRVDCVIFYCATNYEYFLKSLKFEIENGYVVLYHFPWPLTRVYGLIQYSVQVSHINSCYYRHRNYFEYIISQDVDEYVFSEQYPFDLYSAFKHNSMIHPSYKVFAVDRISKN